VDEDKAFELYHQGAELLDRRDFEAAAEAFKRSLVVSVHFKTVERLGVCYREMGHVDTAMGYFRQAYDLNRRNSKTAVLLAELLLFTGQVAEAEAILSDVLARNVTYEPARKLLKSFQNK
jgi:tetratricopeptide (TPR) repeat protein